MEPCLTQDKVENFEVSVQVKIAQDKRSIKYIGVKIYVDLLYLLFPLIYSVRICGHTESQIKSTSITTATVVAVAAFMFSFFQSREICI